jgi:hypothetical protein
MAITFKNVDAWMKKSNVKGFSLAAYPTVGKPYTFNLTHKVAGVGVDTYKATLRSDIVQKLPGSTGKQAAELTFSRESLAATATSLHIQPYDGPEAA